MGRRPAAEEVSAGGVVFRRAGAGAEAGSAIAGGAAGAGGAGGGRGRVAVLVIKDSYRNWGFPKGHVEEGEDAAQAAAREVAEETGLSDLILHGPIRDIDWYFRFRGRLIHKTCTFFLFESPTGAAVPQRDEGISECRWLSIEDALRTISYANAREVLREAGGLVAPLAGA